MNPEVLVTILFLPFTFLIGIMWVLAWVLVSDIFKKWRNQVEKPSNGIWTNYSQQRLDQRDTAKNVVKPRLSNVPTYTQGAISDLDG